MIMTKLPILALKKIERIPERSSHNIVPTEGLAGKITKAVYMNPILRVITV